MKVLTPKVEFIRFIILTRLGSKITKEIEKPSVGHFEIESFGVAGTFLGQTSRTVIRDLYKNYKFLEL